MAIDREKEIKGWRRGKKIRLIESMNPYWYDLAERWTEVYKPEAMGDAREIPIRLAPLAQGRLSPAGESAGLPDDA